LKIDDGETCQLASGSGGKQREKQENFRLEECNIGAIIAALTFIPPATYCYL
jgi:hypothetical protein